MKIEEATVYRIGSKTFDSEEKAQAYEFDQIGEFIDRKILKDMCYGPGDRLKIVKQILANRMEFLALLEC